MWKEVLGPYFRTSFYPKGSKVKFASYLLVDRAHNWLEEVNFALIGEAVETMSWDEFFMRFTADFMPMIKVQQLEMEF